MKPAVMTAGCTLHSECMLETTRKITRKDGGCNILNYPLVSLWYVKVRHAHGTNCQRFVGKFRKLQYSG